MTLPSGRAARLCVVLALTSITYALLITAWQCDDAYLTFRTVQNVYAGHGLTWNPGERVQAYTHPLWMLVALAAYGVSGEVFYSMSLVSLGMAVATAAGFAFVLRARPWSAVTCILALVGSRAFVDFSVSGLENPLLGLMLLAASWLALRDPTPRRDLALSLVVSAAVLTRSDALLLVLPAWGLAARRATRRSPFVIGILPVVVWELFSLVYYGSLVPNTAIAKLNLDLPLARLVTQGFTYFADSLSRDPETLVVTGLASAYASVRGDARSRCLVLGVLLYLAYVVRIGGDFMSGRFLTAPLVLSLAAAAGVLAQQRAPDAMPFALPALLAAWVIAWPGSPLRSGVSYGVGASWRQIVRPTGIADERAYYYPTTSLIRVAFDEERIRAAGLPVPPYEGAIRGVAFARDRATVTEYHEVGLFGFFAGPKYVVDRWALADPLLARIPYRANAAFRIGHYPRPIPAGYLESLVHDDDRIVDPRLHEAYAAIRLVTRGPLWSVERMRAIVALNTGAYADAFAGAAAPIAP